LPTPALCAAPYGLGGAAGGVAGLLKSTVGAARAAASVTSK
jgi:hypothetical protein